MNRLKPRLAFLSFFLFALSSCNKLQLTPGLKIKINTYDSYADMVGADKEMNTNKALEEEGRILFDIEDINFTKKYFIGGICYCPLLHETDCPLEESENCPNLRNRELFVEFYSNTNCITLIYKNMTDYDPSTLRWENNNGGNCYRYEKNYNDKEQYILKDTNNAYIVGLKLREEDETLKNYFFSVIIDRVK